MSEQSEKARLWRQQNHEHFLNWQREYRKKTREKQKVWGANYRERKKKRKSKESQLQEQSKLKPNSVCRRRYLIWYNGYFCDHGVWEIPQNKLDSVPTRAAMYLRLTRTLLTKLKNSKI